MKVISGALYTMLHPVETNEKYLKNNLSPRVGCYRAISRGLVSVHVNVGPKYRSNVESSGKVDKRHQKCEKSYIAAEC